MKQKAVLTKYELKSNKIAEPLTIGLIADLHERKADDLFELLKAAKPDLIAIAGDTLERITGEDLARRRKNDPVRIAVFTAAYYVDHAIRFVTRNKNYADPKNAYCFLRGAAGVAPVFMSLGNHEEELTEEDYALINDNKITLLENSDTTVIVNGQELHIGGVSTICDESWLDDFSSRAGYKILLSHYPEYYDEFIKGKDIDLVLSGHNHGGQIRIFGKGALSSSTGLFPKYDRGVFDGRLVVTAGCSNTTAIPRINNPREVVIIKLSPE